MYTAAIGADLGSWSSSYPDVYALDFDSVATAGTYSISVTGPVAATSPSFVINTGQNVYAAAMANALSFYQNERDGPNFIPSALRTAPGHLNDANAMTYLTPSYNASIGRFYGDLTSLGDHRSTPRADGGTPVTTSSSSQTTSYTVDMMQTARPRLPDSGGSGLHRGSAGSAPTGC